MAQSSNCHLLAASVLYFGCPDLVVYRAKPSE